MTGPSTSSFLPSSAATTTSATNSIFSLATTTSQSTGFSFATTTPSTSGFSFAPSAPSLSFPSAGPSQFSTTFSGTGASTTTSSIFGVPAKNYNIFGSASTAAAPTFGGAAQTGDANGAETGETAVEEDKPPQIEKTEVNEEGAYLKKRIKLFKKIDTEFKDRGICYLFLKELPDCADSAAQIIIRADTVLKTILLNSRISSSTIVQDISVEEKKKFFLTFTAAGEDGEMNFFRIRLKSVEDKNEVKEKLSAFKC